MIEHPDVTSGVNQLSRYAKTVELELFVTEEDGTPVADAEVSFELLNYAELVAISRKKTDADGKVILKTGKEFVCFRVEGQAACDFCFRYARSCF